MKLPPLRSRPNLSVTGTAEPVVVPTRQAWESKYVVLERLYVHERRRLRYVMRKSSWFLTVGPGCRILSSMRWCKSLSLSMYASLSSLQDCELLPIDTCWDNRSQQTLLHNLTVDRRATWLCIPISYNSETMGSHHAQESSYQKLCPESVHRLYLFALLRYLFRAPYLSTFSNHRMSRIYAKRIRVQRNV